LSRAFLVVAAITQIAVGAAGCERRTWTGPLAYAADSIFPSLPASGCDTTSVDLGIERVALPLRSCRVSRGDTTFAVLADGDRRVLLLSRTLTVDSARQMVVHDSIQFAMATVYEAPAICAEDDDLAESEVRVWKTLDRQITLKNLMATQVLLELRVNHPGCDGSG
jgi:hypothetical protein